MTAPLIPFPVRRLQGARELDRVIALLRLPDVPWPEVEARLRPLVRGTLESHRLKALFFQEVDPFAPDK